MPRSLARRYRQCFDREGIPADRYVIGHNRKLQDQVFVVDKWSNRWVVYYTERGSKWDIRKPD